MNKRPVMLKFLRTNWVFNKTSKSNAQLELKWQNDRVLPLPIQDAQLSIPLPICIMDALLEYDQKSGLEHIHTGLEAVSLNATAI
jgi:hypothetical protein